MVEELIKKPLPTPGRAELGVNELIHQAMAAGQFNAAVGAFRVIAEIGGRQRRSHQATQIASLSTNEGCHA